MLPRMNQHLPRPPRLPTQAAEGLPRWRWTVADLDRLVKLGIIEEDDKVELIGGELVPMSPTGIEHETIGTDVAEWFRANVPKQLIVKTELKWRPDEDTYCEPDIAIFPRALRPVSKVPAVEMLLLVEIADSSLNKDTNTKAALYSRLGVREYWVVDVASQTTHVYLAPSATGYGRKRKVPRNRTLKPTLLPGISLRLSDLQFANE